MVRMSLRTVLWKREEDLHSRLSLSFGSIAPAGIVGFHKLYRCIPCPFKTLQQLNLLQ